MLNNGKGQKNDCRLYAGNYKQIYKNKNCKGFLQYGIPPARNKTKIISCISSHRKKTLNKGLETS